MNFSKCLPLSNHSDLRLPIFSFFRLAYEAEINLLNTELSYEEDDILSLSPSIQAYYYFYYCGEKHTE